MSLYPVIASLRSNLSFLVGQFLTTEIATYLAMTSFICHCEPAKQSLTFVIASLRSNLSFGCVPSLERRDRHVPRDDIFYLSLRACEAISLLSVCQL